MSTPITARPAWLDALPPVAAVAALAIATQAWLLPLDAPLSPIEVTAAGLLQAALAIARWLLLLLAILGVGRLAVAALAPEVAPNLASRLLWRLIHPFLAGAAILQALILVGVAIAGPRAALPLLVLPAILGAHHLRHLLHVVRPSAPPDPDAPAWRLPVIVATVLLACGFLAALSPPIESDGLRYHLVAPQEWSRSGIIYLPYNTFTNFPAALGVLTLPILRATPEVFQLLHVTFLVCAALLTGLCARALVPAPAQSTAARTGILAALASPVVLIVGTWPFSDIAAAACCLAILHLGLDDTLRGPRRLILGGLLAGGAAAIKLAAAPAAGILLLGLLAREAIASTRDSGGRIPVPRLLTLALIAGAALLLPLLPWLIKNAIFTGNPVYPALAARIGTGEWTPQAADLLAERASRRGLGRSLAAFPQTLYATTLQWIRFEEQNPGAAFLPILALIGAGAAFLRRQIPRLLDLTLLLALLWIAWFLGYQAVRFLVVPILIASAAAAAVLATIAATSSRPTLIRASIIALFLPGALWTLHYWSAHQSPSHLLQGLGDRTIYLTRGFNAYPAVAWLNEAGAALPEQPGVMYIGEHRAAHATNFRPRSSDWFDTPRILADIRETSDNAAMIALWRREGVRYVLVNWDELRRYLDGFFRPRFTEAEWTRFVDLVQRDLEPRRVWGDDLLYIVDLDAPARP